MTMLCLQRGDSFQALNSVVIPRSPKLYLRSHKSSRAGGWGITTRLMRTLRPVPCACFRRERKWSAKKPSPCFRPFILQKKKRLKALLEWLHWLPWLPWASICKTEEKTLPPPLSLAIPESDIRVVLRERLHILALFFFFYPATPNLLMPTITILIFGEEESRVPPWANAALPERSGQREGRAGSRLHWLCLSVWDGGICPVSASSRSPCMSLSTRAWHRLVLPPLLLPTPRLFPPAPLFPF